MTNQLATEEELEYERLLSERDQQIEALKSGVLSNIDEIATLQHRVLDLERQREMLREALGHVLAECDIQHMHNAKGLRWEITGSQGTGFYPCPQCGPARQALTATEDA